ncbi:MAG: tyrosine--tRNA ligase [Candidatus Altiarchaeota archaeon]|nr:tyrosine--tRNA ligase [Candidatus Altiarchaeota archaeon]
MEKAGLIKRNTLEIVEEAELDKLLKEKKKPHVYCGYETSGAVHIGTMVTVQKLLDFQEAGFEVTVLFADVHTLLNRKGGEDWIKGMVDYWRHSFVALGLDPKKTNFVLGSDFQMKKEYFHDVLTLGLNITVNRATRSMQEVARELEHARVSQIMYPIMQAADVKHLGVDVAYGGIEQRKIHMLAREELEKIGYKKIVCVHTPLLVSIQGPGTKMSSSKPETVITIHEDPKSIEKKINDAYCPAGEAENNPIMQVFQFFVFPKNEKILIKRPEKFGGDLEFASYEELEKAFVEKKLHPLDLKNACARYLIDYLEPVRTYFEKHPKVLDVLK